MDLKIQSQSVQEQAVEKMRTAIMRGVFQPGEKLVEATLCDMLGISRGSLREALRQLAAEKLVTIIPNRGPFIADVSLDEALEIYHVRAMLEGEACYLYATRADEAGIEQMRQALKDFERAVKKSSALERLESTARFYQVILNGCGNRIIAELLQGLIARINFLRARSMSTPGRARHSLAELTNMFTAIEARDARSARAAAVHHVQQASDAARCSFEETSPAAQAQ
ncbi:GntR family transcriptional regulator [Hydrogenophaga sp. BPS33]|uniref:GntR family transcriptional regulator n=1 Tax=Hydrogenophaga sp. BPS33 TaxID=2651974 RepID=UPI001916CD0B|nr:GntR family transcriptional regulator [Hydrogenophaga sp. BPS33]